MTGRQVRRILRAYEASGAGALVSKRRGKPSNRKLPDSLRAVAIALARERYADFGPTLAAEKLRELHGIRVAVETLAQRTSSSRDPSVRARRISRSHLASRLRASATECSSYALRMSCARCSRRATLVSSGGCRDAETAATELLILDELGFVPLERARGELLFNLLTERYERRSVIVTTNLASVNGSKCSEGTRNSPPPTSSIVSASTLRVREFAGKVTLFRCRDRSQTGAARDR
jgi:IstB-like ATP binding protein/Homeodomain-like domain